MAERHAVSNMAGLRGMTQLRWATFGEPSRVNAQPHLDSDGDLVGAHNGNVVNNVELRQQFMAEGMNVRSTNDGESCVHAVGAPRQARPLHGGRDPPSPTTTWKATTPSSSAGRARTPLRHQEGLRPRGGHRGRLHMRGLGPAVSPGAHPPDRPAEGRGNSSSFGAAAWKS